MPDCPNEGFIMERVRVRLDGHAGWYTLALCGAHFLECEWMTPRKFVTRYRINRGETYLPANLDDDDSRPVPLID